MNEESKIKPQVTLRGFALDLVKMGLLKQDVVEKNFKKAASAKVPFVNYLVEKKIIDSYKIAVAAAKYFGLSLLDLSDFAINNVPQDLLNKLVATQKRYVFPIFKRGKRLFVAVADPTIPELQEIQFATKLDVVPVLVEANKLTEFINSVVETQEIRIIGSDAEDVDLDKLEITTQEEKAAEEVSELDVEDAPIVRFVNQVLLDAIKQGASDIHFEPYEKIYRLRYRIDGILYEIAKPLLSFANRVAARIKVMAKLNIAERRIPQDGRFKINLSSTRSIDFRISTCPVTNGEKIVIRLLDPLSSQIKLEELGLAERQKELYLQVIHYPQGMVLVTGPTGSGKTVTLYNALGIINTIDKNISTAENPVEINLEGINQVNINPLVGLTFASALRAFLRQDPDIIMIGEIRDLETAEIAIKAAQTGHLVFSTLHTNSAAETLTRLIDIGIERFDIASSVSLIIAQRLARRLCKHCKKEQKLPDNILLEAGFSQDELQDLKIYEAAGCDRCMQGYKGRVGLYEMIDMSKTMKEAVLQGMNAVELEKLAIKEGTRLLHDSGLDKVREGLISLNELNRIIKV